MSGEIADMALKVATAWTVAVPVMVVLSFAVSALALNRLAALDRWLSASPNSGSKASAHNGLRPKHPFHGYTATEAREHKREPAVLSHGILILATAILVVTGPLVVAADEQTTAAQPLGTNTVADDDEIISLAAYNVTADRIEDFGLRVGEAAVTFTAFVPRPEAPYIEAVLPNTAASKAGLQPGDRILKSDGRSAAMTIFSADKFRKFIRAKNRAAASGQTVKWELEIQPRGTKENRTVILTLPTPPPHWGGSIWRAPEGRVRSTVVESGPLAERCRQILDNGIWIGVDGRFVTPPHSGRWAGIGPTGYQWMVGSVGSGGTHLMTVTQEGGRTEVLLETHSRLTSRWVYRTSPSGALEKAWHFTRKRKGDVPLDEAREGFEHELNLWATKVGEVSPRWPMELIPGHDPNAIFSVLAAKDGEAIATPVGLGEEFLKLPPASEEQRALFSDAFGKLGADADHWAYTETSRGIEDKRVIVTRVDPSKPEAERCVLVSIDGKAPKPADVQGWRDQGGDTPKALGELPPLASLVDLTDVRIHKEETASVVFELPLRGDSAEFPAEKFQALFRVNKSHRGFEDVTVKLRDSFRVAGVVKVTDAGLKIRFQTLDPTLAPQPVFLKAGGGMRVLLVKLSRSFEVTRTDFTRVEDYSLTLVATTTAVYLKP